MTALRVHQMFPDSGAWLSVVVFSILMEYLVQFGHQREHCTHPSRYYNFRRTWTQRDKEAKPIQYWSPIHRHPPPPSPPTSHGVNRQVTSTWTPAPCIGTPRVSERPGENKVHRVMSVTTSYTRATDSFRCRWVVSTKPVVLWKGGHPCYVAIL